MMKRFTDFTPTQQQTAIDFQMNQLDPELVAAAPTQAITIAERRAKRIFYFESTDYTLPLNVIIPTIAPTSPLP